MSYEFYIGKHVNGVGLEDVVPGIDSIVQLWASLTTTKIIKAFNFGGHQEHGGKKWVALKNPKEGKAILVDNGDLKRSIGNKLTAANGAIEVVFGTPVDYAEWHQDGVDEPDTPVKAHKRKIKKAFGKTLKEPKTIKVKAHKRNQQLPQRKVIDVTPLDLADLKGRVEGFLDSQLELA